MEGDAGASWLNPADQAGTSVAAEALPETRADDESAAEVDEQLDLETDSSAAKPVSVVWEQGPPPGPSRLGRRGVIGVCVLLVLLAAGAATGGYFALSSHRQSQAAARDNAAAIAAAEDCVAATQAPDAAALSTAQQKIIDCSTGNFAAQAAVYGPMLMQAYQAANVHVQVSEMRTAVERENDDGSIDLLVALRVKVDNIEAQGQEFGYRLRVQMARDDGQYKIARLDQVAK